MGYRRHQNLAWQPVTKFLLKFNLLEIDQNLHSTVGYKKIQPSDNCNFIHQTRRVGHADQSYHHSLHALYALRWRL